jgi:antitoxin Phd
MRVYTFSEARQRLAALLDEAQQRGAVRIKRRDGREFEIAPVHRKGSSLDVEGVTLGISAEEIISTLKEVRARVSSLELHPSRSSPRGRRRT